MKKNTVRGNNAPFMNRDLRKAIMLRSRLRNKYLNDRTDLNKINYTQQRNHCVRLLRETKKEYFENINENKITDNKKFWKTIKPFLSTKVNVSEKITLIEVV